MISQPESAPVGHPSIGEERIPGADLTGAVIDAYELSPMQAGMLFHAVTEPQRGLDVVQVVATLHEALDEARFVRAWERIAERHPALRTRLRWGSVAQPRQEVLSAVRIPVERLDWRTLDEVERHRRFKELLQQDRERGVALDQAPLMRLSIVSIAADECWVLWTYHHIVVDGRSQFLLLREVFACYEALCRGEDHDPPTPRPYRDYIEWLQTVDHHSSQDYWKAALAGFRASTPLVVERRPEPGDAAESTWTAYEFRLPAALTNRLKAHARRASVTLNNVMQGVWALLLHRYSGEHDVVFGATRACRKSALGGADDMIGMFINTLPLRVRIDPESEFAPWLQQLRQQQMALRDFEHTPLVMIQGWSEVPRGSSLFHSILVFENQTLDTRLRALGGSWAARRFHVHRANLPLVLTAWGDEELVLELNYSRRNFTDDTIRRMAGHLQTLLEGIAARPNARLRDLTLLTDEERRQLAATAPAAHFSDTTTIHERFEQQVELTPDAVALAYEGERLTYTELNRRANRLAHRLRALGVRPDDLVGLRMERCTELVVAILGILKSGGAYLPLDPAYPRDRVAFMLEDSKVAVIVTQQSLASGLEGLAKHCVLLDGDLHASDANPASASTGDHLAYVIYTSGSTGKPKGVQITHYNVTRLFDATQDWYRFDRRDVWTLFHSYAFDFSVWELWGALFHGGRLVVVPHCVSRSPQAFRELLVRERVTVLNQTPSAFRQLVQADAAESRAEFALRYVIFGGEALELASLRPWLDRYGDAEPRLVNMYGITETTVHVTYRPIHRADVESGQGSVIGVPIPDLTLYILDPRGEPAPVGVPGEIYVGGAGVARGYLNRPELNAERFIADPFASGNGARLYRSGDLARRLENGDIEYLGRIDQQVKIRGFRIELGEIEAAIARHPAVRAVAVVAHEDVPGDKRIVAYVVAQHPSADLGNELRAALRTGMPEYMVPAHFVMLDSLPLTENGKVDRKALRPPPVYSNAGRSFDPARTPMEKTIADVWSALLRVERVSLDDNFFDLGGHSLLLMQAHSQLRERLQRDLGIVALFQFPTIRALAQHLSGPGDSAPAPNIASQRAQKQREAMRRQRRLTEQR